MLNNATTTNVTLLPPLLPTDNTRGLCHPHHTPCECNASRGRVARVVAKCSIKYSMFKNRLYDKFTQRLQAGMSEVLFNLCFTVDQTTGRLHTVGYCPHSNSRRICETHQAIWCRDRTEEAKD